MRPLAQIPKCTYEASSVFGFHIVQFSIHVEIHEGRMKRHDPQVSCSFQESKKLTGLQFAQKRCDSS